MKLAIVGALFGAVLGLSACAGVTSTVNTDLSTAQAKAQIVINDYATLKAAALVVELADPQYDTAIEKVEAVADPIVAQLTPMVSDATADAATIESLYNQIEAQVTALKTALPAS
jgi:hypothetical protein